MAKDESKKLKGKELQEMRNTRKIYAGKIEAKTKLEKSLTQCREAMALPQMQEVVAQLERQIREVEKGCRRWKGGDIKAHQAHLFDLDQQIAKINGVADEAALKATLDSIKKYEQENELWLWDMIGKPLATIHDLAKADTPDAPAGKPKPKPEPAAAGPKLPKMPAPPQGN